MVARTAQLLLPHTAAAYRREARGASRNVNAFVART